MSRGRRLWLWFARWVFLWAAIFAGRVLVRAYLLHQAVTLGHVIDSGVLALGFTLIFSPDGLFARLFMTEEERKALRTDHS